MEQINTKIRKWGNSFGIVIPMNIVDSEKLKEGSEIIVTVKPKLAMTVGDLLEFSRKNRIVSKKPTEEIMREMDKELYGIEK